MSVLSNTKSNSRFLTLNRARYTENSCQQSCILSRIGKRLHNNSSNIPTAFLHKALLFPLCVFPVIFREGSQQTNTDKKSENIPNDVFQFLHDIQRQPPADYLYPILKITFGCSQKMSIHHNRYRAVTQKKSVLLSSCVS